MIRGGKIYLLSCSLAAAGCAGTQDFKVRPIADPAAKFRYGGGLLSEGRAQLALGNAGLALETFRRLQREQPESADAFAGIAACYGAMGRYDLARANYEFALAYSPDNPALLTALASSLDRLGEVRQAAQVRAEAVRLSSASAIKTSPGQVVVTPDGVPRVGSITVALPQPSTVRAEPRQSVAKQTPAQSSAGLREGATVPHSKPAAVPTTETAVLKLPQPSTTAYAAPAQLPPAQTRAAAQVAQTDPDKSRGPYLERRSPGEVALVTTPRPVQLAQLSPIATQPVPGTRSRMASKEDQKGPEVPSRQLAAIAPRWVPLKRASAPQEIQLLNAARSQGLAARTRSALLDRGWRRVRIGDARAVRERSLVLYAPARAALARRLAAQFRCRTKKVVGIRSVVVLLGRDSVVRRSPTSRA